MSAETVEFGPPEAPREVFAVLAKGASIENAFEIQGSLVPESSARPELTERSDGDRPRQIPPPEIE